MKRVLSILRSPRLAFALVLGFAAYGVLGTIVPQPLMGSAKVEAWVVEHPLAAALARPFGLFSAFTSPVFLAAAAMLVASLIACAWQRSVAGLRRMRGRQAPAGLSRAPALVAGSVPEADTDPLAAGDGVLAARRRTWGSLGSPLFHWSLALLVLVIAVGQLTRAEGFVSVPIDGRMLDAAASYVEESHGPLFRGHTGLEFGARDLETRTMIAGIDRGPSAVIGLYRDGVRIAEQRVYPNAPLRHGTLMIHPDTWGFAPLLRLETTSGAALAETRGFVASSLVTSSGAGPGGVTFSGPSFPTTFIDFDIPAERLGADGFPVLARALRVTMRRDGEATSAPVVLEEGQRAPVFGGAWLRFAKRGTAVRIIVTNDWSVPFIYALFVLACVALAVALLTPRNRP